MSGSHSRPIISDSLATVLLGSSKMILICSQINHLQMQWKILTLEPRFKSWSHLLLALWAHFLISKVDNVYLIIIKNLEIMHIKVPRPGTPHGFSKCNIISGKFCSISISYNLCVTVTWKTYLFKKSPICKQFLLWISSLSLGNEEKKE